MNQMPNPEYLGKNIHSPRAPTEEEMTELLVKALKVIPVDLRRGLSLRFN